MRQFILLALLTIGLAGCGTLSSDVGMVNYYRVSKNKQQNEQTNAANATLRDEDLRPVVLKYAETNQPAILPGQYFSINMSTAFIGKFFELDIKGEIAIVVRVSERQQGSLEWGKNAADTGRLIYYADYVKEHQTLSMSYIPVYGPVVYTGNSVDIQIYIFEIDNAAQYRPLLQTLTSIGQTAYPPASPILSVLDSLGGALLKGSSNDKLFEYTLCLGARGPISGEASGYEIGQYPTLEAGHYIFTRFQNREANASLLAGQVMFNRANHKLEWKGEDGTPETMYSADSYIVFHAKREVQGIALAEENKFYETFAAFKAQEGEATEAVIENITSEIDGLRDDLIHGRRLKDVYAMYTGVSAAIKGQESYVRTNAAKLLFALREQIGERTKCDADTKKTCKTVMTRREIEELLAQMRSTKAFEPVADQLTYEALPKADVADMISKVVNSLPKSATGNG